MAPQEQGVGHHWAALLAELPIEVASAAVQEAARRLPGLKASLMDSWLAEDYAEDVGAFLTEIESQRGCDDGDEYAPSQTSGEFESVPTESTATEADTPTSEEGAGGDSATRRRTLLVAYFPRSASEDELTEVLDKVGHVRRARLVRDAAGASQCYGFVEFEDEAAAEAVLNACQAGRVMLDDEFSHTWHLRASRARRATATPSAQVGGAGRRRRGTRGGRSHAAGRTDREGGAVLAAAPASAPAATPASSPAAGVARPPPGLEGLHAAEPSLLQLPPVAYAPAPSFIAAAGGAPAFQPPAVGDVIPKVREAAPRGSCGIPLRGLASGRRPSAAVVR